MDTCYGVAVDPGVTVTLRHGRSREGGGGGIRENPAQYLELVLGIGSDGHFDACGTFWVALRENWSGTAANK